MAAYIIVDVSITNAEEYEAYKKLTPPSLSAYNGKFIVRGAPTESLEGDWQPGRIVLLEFPTYNEAKAWWASEEYAAAKVIRQKSASTKMILVEGV